MAEISRAVDTGSRLPEWPFLSVRGYVSICEYDSVLGSWFFPVIHELARVHGDDSITFVVLEPDPSYYMRAYSHFPGFRLAPHVSPDDYWEALSYEPNGDPTGAIAYTANVIALVGSSRRWAVWGQRDWEIALVLAEEQRAPWRDVGVPFLPAREALDKFRGPNGWTKKLSQADINTFLSNVEQRQPNP
jgi:hypothetical protein